MLRFESVFQYNQQNLYSIFSLHRYYYTIITHSMRYIINYI